MLVFISSLYVTYSSTGLRLLQKAGVKLSCFNTETWKFLYVFLGNGLPSESPGKWLPIKYSGVVGDARTEEDRLMQGDLKGMGRKHLCNDTQLCS